MKSQMKKIIFITMCVASATAFAQSKFMFGPSYTFGLSSIYGSKISGTDMSFMPPLMPEYGLKLNAGTGLKAEYFFNEKFGLTLQSGFMQRGAKFDMDAADYSPRYRFNYIDAVIGFQYRGNVLMKKHKDFINIGVSQHTLLNANRLNSYNAVNISSDFKMIDWGVFLGIGHNIPFFEKDILQLQLFANAGLTNIFTGTFETNGISGKNILYGLQVSYLLGKKKTNEGNNN